MKLLEKLVEIRGASGDESRVRNFVINYIETQKNSWNQPPTLFYGEEFQDALIVVFGIPKVALFAHMDSIGFPVGYAKNLIRIGGPQAIDGMQLVGADSQGEIGAELMVVENIDGTETLQYIFEREIERGTILTFKPHFRDTEQFVQSPYLDNRLGVWNALKVAETIENGALVFSTYEEHGGNTVGFCGRFLYEKYGLRKALISDITWVTKGVEHGKGVAISMRDSGLPRRKYLDTIIELAKRSKVPFQLEVESAGGSDGTMLQKTDLPFDWCFIGAPEDNVHSPDEIVAKFDILCMVELYKYLMVHL
jgi:putative aminopeptidase FrvX